MKFINQIWVNYPFPKEASIWGESEDGGLAVSSLDDLIELCVDEIASDLMLSDSVTCYGASMIMPEGTVSVYSAKFDSGSFGFQGNRAVKFNYDKHQNTVYLRMYPAIVSYYKKLTVADLDKLSGDRLVYIKAYVLWKMAEKELTVIRSVNFSSDNVTLNYDSLSDFVSQQRKLYEDMKPEMFIYPGQP